MDLIDKEEICVPENFPGEVPASEESLRELLSRNESDFDANFALGYFLLREGRAEEACQLFKKACELDPSSADAKCNLGISYILSDKIDQALTELKSAVLQKKDFVLAHLHLGRILRLTGDEKGARNSFQKALRVNPKNVRVLLELAEGFEQEGDSEQTEKYYVEAFEADQSLELARDRLAEIAVRKGQALFEKGEALEAFAVWGKAYSQYQRSFSGYRPVAQLIRESAQKYKTTKGKDTAFKEYWKKISANPEQTPKEAYILISKCLFEIGLLPELYVDSAEVDTQLEHWQKESEVDEVVPYATYRLGVLNAFKGNYQECRRLLEEARDHLPSSKRESIKIEKVIRLVKELIALHESKGEAREPDSSPEQQWREFGFSDPFQRKAWQSEGISPREASLWRDANFSARQATNWIENEIELGVASAWHNLDFTDAKEVKRWLRGGFSAEQAHSWSEFFPHQPQTAIQCVQAGFDDPRVAARWMKIFTFPSEAIRWIVEGFSAKDAAVWIRSGVTDPYVAKQRVSLESSEEKPEDEEIH